MCEKSFDINKQGKGIDLCLQTDTAVIKSRRCFLHFVFIDQRRLYKADVIIKSLIRNHDGTFCA